MALPVTAGVIDEFLRRLPHTGAAGFEGLVTLLCERVTGQRFRLAKSGSQHGLDSANELSVANRIKVETKHYFATTLDTRELLGEITQAGDNCDLWVLGATCAVAEQLEKELDKALRKYGCELLILDRGIDAFKSIEALVGKFDNDVLTWASAHNHNLDMAGFRQEADLIRNAAGYQNCIDALQAKLKGTLLGFADAQTRSHEKLRKILSDAGDCRGTFNQEITVCGPNAAVVPRREIYRQLDEWWSGSRAEYQHAVVLGEEGTGKTWAVMDWLASKSDTDFPALIITVSGGMNDDLNKATDAEGFLLSPA